MLFRLVFGSFPFVVFILLAWTFLSPGYLGTRGRAIGLAALLLCAAKFMCFAALGGNAFAPELPEWVIRIWNFAYSGMMILFALSLAGQVVRFLLRKFAKTDIPRTVWLVTLPVIAWGLSARGIWNGTKPPDIVEVVVEFDNLPEDLDGYRIAHLSDIHASAAARRWRTEEIVDRANALRADLLCLTGDYADGPSAAEFANIEPLSRLVAKDGVLAVTGNHEYYYDTIGWIGKYSTLRNVEFLVNSCVFPRKSLAVGGVSDIAAAQFGFTPPDPDAAFASATNGEFRILLQHRPAPDYAGTTGRIPTAHVDLQLSGHTHGGVLPIMKSLVAAVNSGYVRGACRRDDGSVVHVSEGAGQWAGFPMRFMDDPTITLITLRKGLRREK